MSGTRLVHMSGIGIQRDIPKARTESIIYNNIAQSDRDILLNVLDDRADIFKAYYGDPTGNLQKAKNLIFAARNAGNNNLSSTIVGSIDPSLNWVAKGIVQASLISPSRNLGSFPSASISGPGEIRELLEQAYLELQGNPTLNQIQAILNLFNSQAGRDWIYGEGGSIAFTLWSNSIVARNIRAFIALNSHFEQASHHILYSFASNALQVNNTILAVKAQTHKRQVETLSTLAIINQSVFKAMLTNNILRRNVSNGLQPLSPTETIDLLKLGGENEVTGIQGARIGFIDPATIALVGKLVGLLVAALSAAELLVKALRNADDAALLNLELDAMGLKSNSPNTTDFNPQTFPDPPFPDPPIADQENSFGSGSTLLIGAGLIGALLMSDKS